MLLPQLSENIKPLTRSRMFEIAQHSKPELIVARDRDCRRVDGNDSIVAMTLFIPLVTNTVRFGLVEDVVTDQQYLRQGIAEKITRCAIENGRLLKLERLDLHSSNKRKPAHALYLKCGFKLVAEGPERSYFRYNYE